MDVCAEAFHLKLGTRSKVPNKIKGLDVKGQLESAISWQQSYPCMQMLVTVTGVKCMSLCDGCASTLCDICSCLVRGDCVLESAVKKENCWFGLDNCLSDVARGPNVQKERVYVVEVSCPN